MAPEKILVLDSLPDSNDLHSWADYIELKCLTAPDLYISKEDFLSYVQKRKDLYQGFDNYADNGAEENLEDVPVDIKRATWAEDVFRHLEYRAGAFGNFYPFSLPKGGNALARRLRVTLRHKLYAFFLLSSNTGYIRNKSHRNRFTSAFEVVSVKALKEYLPASAKVHLFGSNSLNKGRYSGQLLKKIKFLAQDIGEQFVGEEREFNPRDTGDNGLDVVGWVSLDDNAKGSLMVFGQCACTDLWPGKQHSSSAAHWGGVIKFTAPPSNMAFIPHCYRQNTGEWYKAHKIEHTILMDRLRLIRLLSSSYRSLSSLPYDLINTAISQQIPIG